MVLFENLCDGLPRGWINAFKCVYYAEYHLGQLKAKIAKLRTQLLEPPKVCKFLMLFFPHGCIVYDFS